VLLRSQGIVTCDPRTCVCVLVNFNSFYYPHFWIIYYRHRMHERVGVICGTWFHVGGRVPYAPHDAPVPSGVLHCAGLAGRGSSRHVSSPRGIVRHELL